MTPSDLSELLQQFGLLRTEEQCTDHQVTGSARLLLPW